MPEKRMHDSPTEADAASVGGKAEPEGGSPEQTECARANGGVASPALAAALLFVGPRRKR